MVTTPFDMRVAPWRCLIAVGEVVRMAMPRPHAAAA
jgi:hypothetical protein